MPEIDLHKADISEHFFLLTYFFPNILYNSCMFIWREDYFYSYPTNGFRLIPCWE